MKRRYLIISLLAFLPPLIAYADSKISALSDGSPAVGTDNYIIQRSTSNYKIPASSIATYVLGVDGEISSIAGLTSAADRVPYYTGSGTAALATFGAEARTFTALTDPNADRIAFWDDSAGSYAYLQPTGGLVISGTSIRATESICVAASDETTAITTGTAKITWRVPYAFTVTAVRASLNTVSSSGTPTFDINEAGTSILGTKLSIDASEKTSVTAASAATITDSSLADDGEMTIDIDTAGTGAKGAKICIIGYQT